MRTIATHPFRLHSVSPGQIDRVSKRSAMAKAMLTMANEEEPGHGAVVGGGHGVLEERGDGERMRRDGRRKRADRAQLGLMKEQRALSSLDHRVSGPAKRTQAWDFALCASRVRPAGHVRRL